MSIFEKLFAPAAPEAKQLAVASAENTVDMLILGLREAEQETPHALREDKVEVVAKVIVKSVKGQDNYVNSFLLLAAVAIVRLRELQGEPA